MGYYSYSKLKTFDQCKFKYKLQYIDKLKVEIPTTIEAFLGDLVHKTLEKLYLDLRLGKLLTQEELLLFYDSLWHKNYTPQILIVKKEFSFEHYKLLGKNYIINYYDQYFPFNQMNILGLETKGFLTLEDGNKFHIRIDKLGVINDTYYICDYKTSSSPLEQKDADNDKQLSMYSLWVKKNYSNVKEIVLLWHMLAHNQDIQSKRTDSELKKLENEVILKIDEIQKCNEFPKQKSPLCDYCIYNEICLNLNSKPLSKEISTISQKTIQKLVDDYEKILLSEKELSKEKQEIKEKLINISKEHDVEKLIGSNKIISILPYEKVIFPDDKTELIQLLKEKNIFDKLSMISYFKLNSMILKKELDNEILDKIKIDKEFRLSISNKNN